MTERLSEKSLFAEVENGVAYHNVGQDVLSSSDKATQNAVSARYGLRAGHFPDNSENNYVVVEHIGEEEITHFENLSKLIDKKVTPITLSDLAKLEGSTLIESYINSPDSQDRIKKEKNDVVFWGLNPELVEIMGDKSFSNTDIRDKSQDGETGLRVPDLIAVKETDMIQDGMRFYLNMQEKYQKIMPDYQTELVIRFSQSDGGYGNAFITVENDKFVVQINGDDSDPNINFSEMKDALVYAREKLRENMDLESDKEHEVVISRAIDVETSPGISILIVDGEFYSLDWNGQFMTANGKACVGTGSITPKREDLVDRSAYEIIEYVKSLAKERNIDISKTNGIFNADLMVPGPKERKLLELQGERDPESVYYFVEWNPRFTNRTDAIAMAAHIAKVEHNHKNYKTLADLGVTALDKVPHKYKTTAELRNRVSLLDEQAQERHGERVILRMPGLGTAGIIYMGDFGKNGKEVLEQIG